MSIIGIIVLVLGVAAAIYGNYLNNDFGVQLESLFDSGRTNPGDIFMYIGIAAAVVGLILLIIGLVKRTQNTP